MTTDILLTLIAVLLLVRIVLQIWQSKETPKRAYATASEIEYFTDICDYDIFAVSENTRSFGKKGWKLASVLPIDVPGNKCYALFFTRKKIKNYLEK